MKEITQEQIDLLIKNNVLHNSEKGYVDNQNNKIGFYRTRNKRYIEDKYIGIAKTFA